ncbi:hypothetical protein AAC387_Pa09g2143 [Persea americana]
MGNCLRCCIACVLPCGALDVVRVLHVDGSIDEYRQRITAGEVMKANPKHVLAQPIGEALVKKPSFLHPDAELRKGKIYFLVPAYTLQKESKAKPKSMQLSSSKRSRADESNDVIDHYVKTLAKVLGSEMDAQMCIYHFSWQTHFGFCCDIDKGTSRRLAGLPGVLSVRPDMHFQSLEKDYSLSSFSLGDVSKSSGGTSEFLAEGSSKYWLVRMGKPPVEVVTKAQAVDYYAQTLTKVLGNEKDAQMRIYHISWQNHFGFCCELDEECGRELAGVPGVLSIQPDSNYESDHKDYEGGDKLQSLVDLPDKSDANQTPYIRTKRLFVTGLSFYTSEKTLRAAFEGFGELVEVKIIMDKISKRSKGYAFIEYTTEEAAGAALKEMNGKIINGWMIVVDVAKTNPNRPRPRV